MTPQVECLRCGEQHTIHRSVLRQLVDGECPRCGYLGWAYTADLTQTSRQALRRRPPEQRRLTLVA